MLSRCLLIISGVALLLVALAGVVAWVTGFAILKGGLLGDDTYILTMGAGSGKITLSGRLVAVIAIVVPLVALLAGLWLFRLAFERDDRE